MTLSMYKTVILITHRGQDRHFSHSNEQSLPGTVALPRTLRLLAVRKTTIPVCLTRMQIALPLKTYIMTLWRVHQLEVAYIKAAGRAAADGSVPPTAYTIESR